MKLTFNEQAKNILNGIGMLTLIYKEKEDKFEIGGSTVQYIIEYEKELDDILKMKFGEHSLGYTVEYPGTKFMKDYEACVIKDSMKIKITIETDHIENGMIDIVVEAFTVDGEDIKDHVLYKKQAVEIKDVLTEYVKNLVEYRLHLVSTDIKVNLPNWMT